MSNDADFFMDHFNDDLEYALTWHGPGGRLLYWSLHKGWTSDPRKAWVLDRHEVDTIEDNERLMHNLPQHKERKEGANWEPIFRFLNEDDELTYLATSTGD